MRSSRIPIDCSSPNRPASIRTLCGALTPVPVGVLNLKGAAISVPNYMLRCPGGVFLADLAVTRTRRFAINYAATVLCFAAFELRNGSYTSPVTHNR